MKLTGDPDGLEELKFIKENKIFYLKFLLKEAETNTNRTAEFKDRNGNQRYKLTYNPFEREFRVEKIT